MKRQLVTPPAVEPLTYDELKAHLRVDTDDERSLIEALGRTARKLAERNTGRSFITQTLDLFDDVFRPILYLSHGPIQSVETVEWTDESGGANVVPPAEYQVDLVSTPARLLPAPGFVWPVVDPQTVNAVRVRVIAGWGDDGDAVPEPIQQALLLMVAGWFDNRAELTASAFTIKQMPFGAKALLGPYFAHRIEGYAA